jgi:uncharacterized Fe-S cluster-containing radical SAM superfamily protein
MTPIYTNQGYGQLKIIKKMNSCGTFGSGIISLYGCNLKCPFCFAQKYSYQPLDSYNKRDFSHGEISQAIIEWIKAHPTNCYLQITGGEPLLNEHRTDEIVQAIVLADKNIVTELRVIYQTNGSFIGKTNKIPPSLLSLRSLRQTYVLFEISFKGTNPEEYSILSGTGNPDGFYDQCRTYWLLRELICDNVSVVARLGCGHHRNTIHFVDPNTLRSMFLYESWDIEFKRIHDDISSRYGKQTMLAECLNAEGDGAAHSYLHRSIPAIERCLNTNCVSSRSYSKAIERIYSQKGVEPPQYVNSEHLRRSYLEFQRYFEPMGKPSHAYCGRNEFSRNYRQGCRNCEYC